MITSFIQLGALIIFLLVLLRETKRDRLKERHLFDAFASLRKEICNLSNELVTRVEETAQKIFETLYSNLSNDSYIRHQNLKDGINSVKTDGINNYNSLASALITITEKQIPEIITRLNSFSGLSEMMEGSVMQIQRRLDFIEDQSIPNINVLLNRLDTTLSSIEEPLLESIQAQKSIAVKRGQTNSNLYRKLSASQATLVSTRTTLANAMKRIDELKAEKESEAMLSACMLADFVAEISAIRSWIESRGMPMPLLDKHLNSDFKGNIPSVLYHAKLAEKQLHQDLESSCGE